ncbi:hypothetical protein HRG_013633 [Hirsutella rhossiliensis]
MERTCDSDTPFMTKGQEVIPKSSVKLQGVVMGTKLSISLRTLPKTHLLASSKVRASKRLVSSMRRIASIIAESDTERMEIIHEYSLAPRNDRVVGERDQTQVVKPNDVEDIVVATPSSQSVVGMGGVVHDTSLNSTSELASYSVTLGLRDEQNRYIAEIAAVATALAGQTASPRFDDHDEQLLGIGDALIMQLTNQCLNAAPALVVALFESAMHWARRRVPAWKRGFAEQALVLLQENIYKTWRMGKVLGLVSFDVKGAYNEVFKNRLLQRLAARGLADDPLDGSIVVEEAGLRSSHVKAYQHRGELLLGLYLYDYVSLVRLKRDSNDGSCAAVQQLALFVPWELFLCEEMGDINSIWARARKALAPRISCLINNVQLLRRPAEDAERDAKRWASTSGDGYPTVGHVGRDDAGAESTVTYQSISIGNATRLIDVVRGAVDSNQMAAKSPELMAMMQQLCRFQQSVLRSTAELEAAW